MPAFHRRDVPRLHDPAAMRRAGRGRRSLLGLEPAESRGGGASALADRLPRPGFWTVELEPGWSLFATHPVNRHELPFRLLSGLVDADRFSDIGILFPAVWTDPDFAGVLARGTPIAQCFPVPRAALSLNFAAFTPDETARYAKTATDVLGEPGVYRKRFRVRRGSPPRE